MKKTTTINQNIHATWLPEAGLSIVILDKTGQDEIDHEIEAVKDSSTYLTQKATACKILADLIISTESGADFIQKMNRLYAKVCETKQRNIKTVQKEISPYEPLVKSIDLCYLSAGDNSRISIVAVNEEHFNGRKSNRHFRAIENHITKEMDKFVPGEEWFHFLAYAGGCNKTLAMNLAAMGYKHHVLTFGNMSRSFEKFDELERYCNKHFKITGQASQFGNIVIPGTHAKCKANTHDGWMHVPLALPFFGKMMSGQPRISGMLANPLRGVDLVSLQYTGEKSNSATLADKGLIQVIEGGHVQGLTTAYKGDLEHLLDLHSVAVLVQINHALISYTNLVTFSAFTDEDSENLKDKLHGFFSSLCDENMIKNAPSIELQYNTQTQSVTIILTDLEFIGAAVQFSVMYDASKKGTKLKEASAQ